MSIGLAGLSARQSLTSAVRTSVFTSFQTYSNSSLSRWSFATYQAQFQSLWRLQMNNTFNSSSARISTWIPSWYETWRQSVPQATPTTPASPSAPDQGSSGSGRKKLSSKDIKDYKGEGTVLTHGTPRLDVAKGDVPLQAETVQGLMKNPMQKTGVYAYAGIEGSRSYGAYGVLIRPGDGWEMRGDTAWIFHGESPVPEDQILGYFVYEEIKGS